MSNAATKCEDLFNDTAVESQIVDEMVDLGPIGPNINQRSGGHALPSFVLFGLFVFVFCFLFFVVVCLVGGLTEGMPYRVRWARDAIEPSWAPTLPHAPPRCTARDTEPTSTARALACRTPASLLCASLSFR